MRHRLLAPMNALLPLLIILLLSACGEDKKTIASSTSQSPDGSWVATVDVIQYGGPGTAGLQTQVSLSPSRQPDHRAQILLIEDNQVTSSIGRDVSVSWQGAGHLNVRYPKGSVVDFQAIKAAGITVSSEEVGSS